MECSSSVTSTIQVAPLLGANEAPKVQTLSATIHYSLFRLSWRDHYCG